MVFAHQPGRLLCKGLGRGPRLACTPEKRPRVGFAHRARDALGEGQVHTLPSLNVDQNPKSEIKISREFSMVFSNRIDDSNRFFKIFPMETLKTITFKAFRA